MEKIVFTYEGKEALEMLKVYFPKTWRQEIVDGQIFIRGLMKFYGISALDSFKKFIHTSDSPYNGISTFAALYLMTYQNSKSAQIVRLRAEQLKFGIQLVALENSQVASFLEKKDLRLYYLTKQRELQERIDQILLEFPLSESEVFAIEAKFPR